MVLSFCSEFLKWSHAFLVYSGQLLAWRYASTVASALWVWIELVEEGSGLGEVIVGHKRRVSGAIAQQGEKLTRRNEWERQEMKKFLKGFPWKIS